MHFLVENFEGKKNQTIKKLFFCFINKFYFRAFKAILKCHRTQYRPSSSFYRISATTITDQIRVEKSHSCDITTSHSFGKSDSLTSYRISCDSQRQFIPVRKNKNFLDRPQLSVFRCISNPNVSKSVTSLDNSSPWHLREPNFVR
jgi:hypothetical protein